MSKFNVITKRCPLCHSPSVARLKGKWARERPTHHCGNCGADLSTHLTWSVLWALPIGAVALSVAGFAVAWLNRTPSIAGVVRVAILGGVFGFVGSAIMNIGMRGIALRRWQS